MAKTNGKTTKPKAANLASFGEMLVRELEVNRGQLDSGLATLAKRVGGNHEAFEKQAAHLVAACLGRQQLQRINAAIVAHVVKEFRRK